MNVNDIIILDNDVRYTLLRKVNYNDDEYFLAMPIDEEENIDRNKVLFLKKVIEGDDIFVEMVGDQDLRIRLSKIIYNNYT